MKKINATELKEMMSNSFALVDARPTSTFTEGFISGFINIINNHLFIKRLKTFFGPAKSLILICEPNDEDQLVGLIKESGIKIAAVHNGSMDDWKSEKLPLDMIISVDAYELKLDLEHDSKALVLDVREEADFELEHIVGATNMPVREFMDVLKLSTFDDQQNIYLHCNGGTRSVLACSILKKNGYHNIRNIDGGFKAVREDGNIPVEVNKTQLN